MTPTLPRVIIESPYYSPDKDEQDRNIEYALECLRDSLGRGEAPFASHLLYTRVVNDAVADERRLGLTAALEWIRSSQSTAIYIDRGVSAGMRLGIQQVRLGIQQRLDLSTVMVRSLRGDTTGAERIQAAYELRPSHLPVEQCTHQLDSPLFGRSPRGMAWNMVGWRCGCGQTRTGLEVLP